MITRPLFQIFEHENGVKLQVKPFTDCEDCYFWDRREMCCECEYSLALAKFLGCCSARNRSDNQDVIFDQLKIRKLGEVFIYKDICLKVIPGKDGDCKGCYFRNREINGIEECMKEENGQFLGSCFKEIRGDGHDVVFRKLPKIKTQFRNPKLT